MTSASSSSKLTTSCVLLMVMVMMMAMETGAMPRAHPEKADGQSKHSGKPHRKPADPSGAAAETVPLQLDPDTLVPAHAIRPLGNYSLSPWTYETSYDDSLFPPVLSEARCSLRGCRDAEGGEDLSLESKPIMHQVLLLRRVTAPGGRSYHYRLETRLLSVGCTCVRPSVQQQD